jgi:hypothetical protein
MSANAPPKRVTVPELKKVIKEKEIKIATLERGRTCYLCGRSLVPERFYKTSDPRATTGVTPICRDCFNKIVNRIDENGDEHGVTKESMIEGLRYLDKPFSEVIWESAQNEVNNAFEEKSVASEYIRLIQKKQFQGKTWADSDFLKKRVVYQDEIENFAEDDEVGTFAQAERDKKDVIRLLGYDPFTNESEADKPFLYYNLLGMLDSDEENNEDMMRTSAAISITRDFLQMNKLNDTLSSLVSDYANMADNSTAIKNLQDAKMKLSTSITKMAAENCLSLKNSRNATKGENTWTGKIKKLKDFNLREAEINGFDVETCQGMAQVMDMSHASILKQLNLDESEYSSMLAEARDRSVKEHQMAEAYKEVSRILLRENLDLKDTMVEKGLIDSNDLKPLEEIYSRFGISLQEMEAEE